MSDRISLGQIRVPSGIAVIIDAGLMHLWCHTSFDEPERWHMDEQSRASALTAQDLRIEGPDAEQAGRIFDRQWHPRWLYDIPREHLDSFRGHFRDAMAKHGLKAELVANPQRIPHRQRIDLAIAHAGNEGEVQYHGLWAAVCGGLPTDRELEVFAERMPAGPDQDRWRRIVVDIRPGIPIAGTKLIGRSMVDMARLMVADADALGGWTHDESLDGKADVVFWGADAARLAERIKAPSMHGDNFGWHGLVLPLAEIKINELDEMKQTESLKLAVDFRPHSHHWQLMEQVRRNKTEAGTIEIGAAKICGFMTTWGDAIYDILLASGADGKPVQLIIDCGNEAMVTRQRDFEDYWFGDFAKLAFVTKRIMEEKLPVGYLFREPADRPTDSGWRLMAGDETQDYMDDADNLMLVPLRDLVPLDKGLKKLFKSPVGTAFERTSAGDYVVVPFRPSKD